MSVVVITSWRPLQPLWLRVRPADSDDSAGSGANVTELAAPQGPAMLTVRRTATDDVQDRQVYLSIDGEEWTTLVRRSVEFGVRAGEHVRFQFINSAHWTAMLFMAFLGAAILTVRLERESAGT